MYVFLNICYALQTFVELLNYFFRVLITIYILSRFVHRFKTNIFIIIHYPIQFDFMF